MGLTDKGYYRPTYEDILNSMIQKAKNLFGEDIETSEQTPLGKFIRIVAYDLAKAYEDIEITYYARYPNTASGVNLDRLLPFAGITRNPATPATHKVIVTGDAGYTVPFGFLVSTVGEITFYNTADTVIGTDGTCEILVDCELPGVIGNVAVGEITEVTNPVAEVTGIEHEAIVTLGEEEENDVQLRKRFITALRGAGSCNVDSIASAVLRVPTVNSVSVLENETESTDANEVPPHTFKTFVHGGESYHQEIAEAIFSKKPIGIKAVGDVTVNIIDSGGYTHVIGFSHTENIVLRFKVTIKTNAKYEATGAAEIAENIVSNIENLGVGEDVIISSLYGPIYAVNGVVDVTSLLVSTDGTTYTAGNVVCGDHQVPTLIASNVAVEVVTQ